MRIRRWTAVTLLALVVLLPLVPAPALADDGPSAAVALFRQGERDFANRLT